MKGEKVQTILIPKLEDDWVLIQTDKGLYSFRLGGFRCEESIDNINNYETLSCPYKGEEIQEVYTDDEWVYVLVGEGGIIASGWTNINQSGEMDLGVKFSSLKEYGLDFFDSDDLFSITSDSDGRSKRV